ncbi:MAG TPA: ABC transporter permease [Candidatus Dormibacteraeota bacterium]|nr:ABC transporter permease [Candidatus Dormibacteraeota bacterium]
MNAIINMELRKNVQDRGLIFWTLILPIIFTVLFISVFTSGMDEATQKEVITSIVPGYVVMFVFFIMISMVSTFIKDRDHGIVARLASTPLPPSLYLFGKWIPYMYVVLIQMFILFLFGKLVYNIPLEQPILLLILSISLTFTVTGLGLALALFSKTENMGLAITQVVSLGGAMLAGLWIPYDMLPNFLQMISKFLPQYWAHQAFQEAMTGTLAYIDFFQVIGILFGFGGAGFIVALLQYPKFLKQARN